MYSTYYKNFKQNDSGWINSKIRYMIKHKNFLLRKARRTKTDSDIKKMKNFNEILKQLIRSTKQSYFARLISQANGKTKLSPAF